MVRVVFNEIGMNMQSKYRFIPILVGDLGLSMRLNTELNTNEIEYLIPDTYFEKHWTRLCKFMRSRHFELIRKNGRKFQRDSVVISFGSIEKFKEITGINTSRLPREHILSTYFLPSKMQFHKYYNILFDNADSDSDREFFKSRIDLIESSMREDTIDNIKKFIKELCQKDVLLHDYTHYIRVSEMSERLAEKYGADKYVTVLSSLLYEIDPAEYKNVYKVDKMLLKEFVSKDEIKLIKETISQFNSDAKCRTVESKCLSDAHYLDCIGAVGIAVGFAECSKRNLPMYPLDIFPIDNSDDIYRKSRDTLEHFRFIKNKFKHMFYTEYAKELAKDRMEFMQDFLYRFYDECEGLL